MPKMTKHLKRPVVAFFESIRTKEAYFSQNIPDADCRFVAGNLTQKNALRAKDAQGISVFVGSKVTRQVL
ncbi:hypothetical protein FJZ26_05520, partial [Candidatus Parvarchaeota archaeon]|nr:hypothetical protein [Candidatus Parvarchaeota archaeon]